MPPKKWVYLVSHSRSRSPFLPAHSGFFLRLPSPCSLAQTGFILSYASLLYRVLPSLRSASGLRLPVSQKRLPWGSRSLFATSAFRVLCPEPFSSARCLAVLGVSHALDGFLRGWPRGFISPHCHVQGSLFRGFILVRSRTAFRRPLPSRRCLGFADGQLPIRLHSTEPRPQGFAPRPNPQPNHRGLADARARFPS